MYSLLLFLGSLSTWLFSRYYFRGKSFWMLVLVNVLLVHTHYFGWFVVASEVLAIAVAQRIKILQTLLMLGVTAAAFVPWLFAIYRFAEPGSGVAQNIGWMQRPGIATLFEFAFDLLDPFYFQQSNTDASTNLIIAVPLAAVILSATVVYFVNFRADENKDQVLFLSMFAAAPTMLAFILSWLLPVSIWGSRHLLIVFDPITILFAIFLTQIAPVLLRRGMVGVVFLLAAAAFVMQLRTQPAAHIWCAWEGLAVEWRQWDSQPKSLYVFEDLVAYHYWFATLTLPIYDYDIMVIKGIEGVPNDPAYFLPRGFDEVKTAELNSINEEEIWVSFRQPAAEGLEPRFLEPVTSLENLGYVIADVKHSVRGLQTAYLMRMTKRPPNEADK